jgi:hypothetical protein
LTNDGRLVSIGVEGPERTGVAFVFRSATGTPKM